MHAPQGRDTKSGLGDTFSSSGFRDIDIELTLLGLSERSERCCNQITVSVSGEDRTRECAALCKEMSHLVKAVSDACVGRGNASVERGIVAVDE